MQLWERMKQQEGRATSMQVDRDTEDQEQQQDQAAGHDQHSKRQRLKLLLQLRERQEHDGLARDNRLCDSTAARPGCIKAEQSAEASPTQAAAAAATPSLGGVAGSGGQHSSEAERRSTSAAGGGVVGEQPMQPAELQHMVLKQEQPEQAQHSDSTAPACNGRLTSMELNNNALDTLAAAAAAAAVAGPSGAAPGLTSAHGASAEVTTAEPAQQPPQQPSGTKQNPAARLLPVLTNSMSHSVVGDAELAVAEQYLACLANHLEQCDGQLAQLFAAFDQLRKVAHQRKEAPDKSAGQEQLLGQFTTDFRRVCIWVERVNQGLSSRETVVQGMAGLVQHVLQPSQ